VKPTIIVCDHIHQSGLDLLSNTKDINYKNLSHLDKETLLNEIKDATVVITRSSTDVDIKFLDAAPNLKAIVRAGVGVDNVDINECSKRGIIVMNVPTANTLAATELTMAHMLACVRKLPYAHNQLKNERIWKREDWYGTELSGKKLGIIGFGNIGSRVGIRAKAFEMDVIAYDPYIDPSKATNLGVKYTKNFDDILKCDIITIHTPKNEETINMISYKEIEKMKDGVILINCARGGLYNEDALYDGLKSGKIKMAGIDVFSKEPATNNKLLELDNVIVTAHLGANTVESQYKIATQAATNAINAARGISYANALNLPIDETKIPTFVKPYLELIQKMAFLIAQLEKEPIKSIKVKANGEISQYSDSLLTFAIVGALVPSMGIEKINYVNATFVAKEKGIETKVQTKEQDSVYKNKIEVEIITQNNSHKISGTIFDEEVLRIVEIDGYKLEIVPNGKMIFFRNSDVPGVIGEVGKILGDNNINIADFRLGRNNDGALAVIIVDNEVKKEVLDKLAALKAAKSVNFVNI